MEKQLDVSFILGDIQGTFREKFEKFHSLLLEYNEKFNLTAIIEEKEVRYKHFFDSLSAKNLIPPQKTVLEVGSGAGFPSVPLMIAREDLNFTLMESVGKKCQFLQTIVDNFSFNAKVINARAEDCAKKEEFRESFDCVVARAVARLNVLCEYCLPFVKVGGTFLAYKGDSVEEVIEAERAIRILGGKLREVYTYDLPEGMGKRTIVVIEKIKNTPEKYPRGQGKERKSPL